MNSDGQHFIPFTHGPSDLLPPVQFLHYSIPPKPISMNREKRSSWLGNLFHQWFPVAPALPGARLVQARRLYDEGAYRACIQQLTVALAMPADPTFVPASAFKWRGLAYRALGDYAAALADLEEVIRRKPESRGGYIDLAALHRAEGEIAAALAVLSRGIERVPAVQVPPLYLERGKVSYAAGDHLAAIDDFNVAVYHLPRQAEGWWRRGLSRAALHEYHPARRDCEKAVALAADDHRAHYALGRVLFRAGRCAAAAKALQRAVELQPEERALLSLLGRVWVQQQEFGQALAVLQTAVDLGANDTATLDALRQARLGEPRTTDRDAEAPLALEVLEPVEQPPLFPGFYDDLPTVYERQQTANEALQEFLGDHLRYPQIAGMMGLEGVVWIAFTVERDGRLSHPAVYQGVSRELDQEALRIVQCMIELGMHWQPARRHDAPVRVRCRLPVVFRLTE